MITKEEIKYIKENFDNIDYDDIEESYCNLLNDSHDIFKIGYLSFYPSEILINCDPIAFNEGLNDYISADYDEIDSLYYSVCDNVLDEARDALNK